MDFVDEALIEEMLRRSVGKNYNTVRLLRCKSHICYVSNINSLFKAYHFASCDQFIKKLEIKRGI